MHRIALSDERLHDYVGTATAAQLMQGVKAQPTPSQSEGHK